MDDSTSHNRFSGKPLMCVCYSCFTILIAFKCHYVFHLKFQIAQERRSLPYYLHTIVFRYIEWWRGLAKVERAILSFQGGCACITVIRNLCIKKHHSQTKHNEPRLDFNRMFIWMWSVKEQRICILFSRWTKMWHFFFCANVKSM